MALTLSPTVSDALRALSQFLLYVLPLGPADVVTGQQNRVAEPGDPSFLVMTPIRFERLLTNVDSSADCRFNGQISANVLTVNSVDIGSVVLGLTVFGVGVAANTQITKFITGTGGAGTYQVSRNQAVAAATMSAGGKLMMQEARAVIQVDFHSIDSSSLDMAQLVSTSLRDEFATSFFAALDPPLNSVAPLYADDPRQIPFVNDQQQYEWRSMLEVHLQVNQTAASPAQYADEGDVMIVDVDAAFPP